MSKRKDLIAMKLTHIGVVALLLGLPTITGCGSTGVSAQPTGSGPTVSATISPSSLSFGNTSVGSTSAKTVVITNTGTADLVVSAIDITGSAFSLSGVTLPLTVAAGASYTASVIFTPQSVGNASGSASIVSNLSSSPNVVTFTGTGVSTPVGTLNASPVSLAFGNVNVGSSSSKTVTLSNSGTASVSVSSISFNAPGYATSATTPFTVAAGNSTSITVTFAPQASGAANGIATLSSNAGNSPATVSLSGTGTTVTAHSVALSWIASTSVVVGYNVYRGSQTGGPYQKINSTLQSGSGYTDTAVTSGQTYHYVVTAVDGSGTESTYSNEAIAAIP